MVTAIVDDLFSMSKITEAGKKAGIDVRILSPKNVDLDDDFYIIDYIHPYGVSAARTIKNAKPGAKIVGFYPHTRFYIKDEVEACGCIAFTNAEFFAKVKDIVKASVK
mgnify:CR=1 FL=1